MSELWQWSAGEIAAAVRGGQVSAREVTDASLARLAAVNPAINAVVVETGEEARAAARAVDAAIARGSNPGPLAAACRSSSRSTSTRPVTPPPTASSCRRT